MILNVFFFTGMSRYSEYSSSSFATPKCDAKSSLEATAETADLRVWRRERVVKSVLSVFFKWQPSVSETLVSEADSLLQFLLKHARCLSVVDSKLE